MKRRNVEVGKMRRPMKRSKIPEGLYGSTLLYFKFFILWALVILADFILEFRFEFLWPFYLLMRSVYDSFKYQGLAFSVFFVCVALTSDMLCFFFIPVHWLFFAASTYVWVQYVWHTDKGICGPTIVLWMLFVYIEAAVRLRDVKHLPGHMDLCRPFAAHCIGYPVVTLGFGFKSYVGFRMRQKKQRDVAKENDFYLQLMQQALPAEAVQSEMQQQVQPAQQQQQQQSVAAQPQQPHHNHHQQSQPAVAAQPAQTSPAVAAAPTVVTVPVAMSTTAKHHSSKMHNGHMPNGVHSNGVPHQHHQANGKPHHRSRGNKESAPAAASVHNGHDHHDDHQQTSSTATQTSAGGPTANGDGNATTVPHKHKNDHRHGNQKMGNGVLVAGVEEIGQNQAAAGEQPPANIAPTKPVNSRGRRERKEQTDKENREQQEYLQRLEQESKRLRVDLQSSRASEQDLRLQVVSLTTSEKVSRGEMLALQRELEDMQSKVQSAHSSRAQDKQAINNLERRLADERRMRANLEAQLSAERKIRKQEEARVAQAAALAAAQAAAQQAQNLRAVGECTDACRQRRRDLESENASLRNTQSWYEKEVQHKEREHATLNDKLRETEIVVSALNAMQEKTQHLENSLSAETRIKLDLFSALGEVKRQLEIKDSCLRTKEKEIEELKSKIAQVVAVMPETYVGQPAPSNLMSRVRLTATSGVSVVAQQQHHLHHQQSQQQQQLQQQQQQQQQQQADGQPGSTLDPNATAYTPKVAEESYRRGVRN